MCTAKIFSQSRRKNFGIDLFLENNKNKFDVFNIFFQKKKKKLKIKKQNIYISLIYIYIFLYIFFDIKLNIYIKIQYIYKIYI